jgi:hypothetical protein
MTANGAECGQRLARIAQRRYSLAAASPASSTAVGSVTRRRSADAGVSSFETMHRASHDASEPRIDRAQS